MLPSGGSYTYEYMLKDHLGNIRAMVKSDGSIIDISDYYVFGLEIGDPITPSPDNKYKYNGKEWNTELSLNSYDYGARFYDPVVGRWNVVDPLAEKGRRWSPYAYGFNNPMRFTDPDGMWPWDGIVERATNYVVNAAKQTAYNVAKATVDYVKQTVKDLEPAIYAKGEVKASGQVGGSVSAKGVGVKVNVKGQDLGSVALGGEASTKTWKATNTSEASYYGKSGDVKQTSGAGVDAIAGASTETETTMNNGQVTNTRTSRDVSVALPVVGGIQAGLSTENGRSTLKSGYVNSVNVGLFLNFSATFEAGILIRGKKED